MDVLQTVEQHMRILTERIGERFIGTQGNKKASDYIRSIFESSHLETHQIDFSCPSWYCDGTTLQVGETHLHASANPFSPPCQVQAPYEVAFTLEQLRNLSLENRILVLCGELTQQTIVPYNENAIYLPESAREIGLLLRAKRPLAIICVNQTPEYEVFMLEDPRLNTPSVTISADEGIKLLQHLGELVSLTILSRSESGETSHIIGRNLQPSGQRRLILCAHYDTRYGTVGAMDNASGVAVLLTLVEQFAIAPPGISLEFIAFSSEEYQVADSLEEPYLSQYGLSLPPYQYGKEIMVPHKPSDLDNVVAVLNFDGVGHTLGANTVSAMASSEALKDTIAELKKSVPTIALVGGWPASNHYGFYSNGIPSLPFNSVGMNNVIHHPRDDVRYMSSPKLTEVISFAEQIVHILADKSPAWSRAFDLP